MMLVLYKHNQFMLATCMLPVCADKMQHPDVKSICIDEWAGGIIMYHIRDELNRRSLDESRRLTKVCEQTTSWSLQTRGIAAVTDEGSFPEPLQAKNVIEVCPITFQLSQCERTLRMPRSPCNVEGPSSSSQNGLDRPVSHMHCTGDYEEQPVLRPGARSWRFS